MRDNDNARTNPPENGGTLELWAPQEVCASLGWTRHRLKLAREGEGFPAPLAVVAGGRIAVWDAGAVRSWAADARLGERTREWRRAEAVRMYRRGNRQAEICRKLRAKADSVRKWLRDAGEVLPGDRRDASA